MKNAEVTLVNYGLGNIRAFANIYESLNIPVKEAKTAADLSLAKRIVLPGVGAFDWAMSRLYASGMRDMLDDLVLRKNIPVLGVCVGMQIMARCSEEGEESGLGWIDAKVMRFRKESLSLAPLPHMGWNDVQSVKSNPLFSAIESPRYYFLHSYYIEPVRPSVVLATARYGSEFTAAVCSNHIYGTQFHPEKSHRWGIDLLRNFATL